MHISCSLVMPQIRGFAQTLRVTFDERGPHSKHAPDGTGRYGHKIYGYLKPQHTGVCVCAFVCACMGACMRVCMRACVYIMCVCVC